MNVTTSAPLRSICLTSIVLFAALLEWIRIEEGSYTWQSAVVTLATLGIYCFCFRRAQRLTLDFKHGIQWGLLGLIFVASPFLLEIANRSFFQRGNPLEMVQLLLVRNLLFALSIFSHHAVVMRCAFVLSLFVEITALTLTNHWVGYVLFGCYGIVAAWWLMAGSWEKTAGRAAASIQREFPRVAVGTVLLLTIGGAIAGAMLNRGSTTTALAGWYPSSGGRDRADPFAISGVKDGEALVAGKEDAQSFGALESELFMQSEMPTLYDVFDDSVGVPLCRKHSERSIGLSTTQFKRNQQERAVSQAAGKEFSTLRRKTLEDKNQQALKSLKSADLLHLVGNVPLHLRLETFDHFDGIAWKQTIEHDDSQPPLQISIERGRPWVWLTERLSASEPTQQHLLKIINLRSPRIVTPCGVLAAHLDKIDDVSFFGRTPDGMLWMPQRSHVPQLQVIHLVSRLPPYQSKVPTNLKYAPQYDAKFALPNQPEIKELATKWTHGTQPGREQINALVASLQAECTLNNDFVTDPESENTVADFLLKHREGPAYLFASATAVMLRELGYPTRLVAGLYASPDAYDARSGQTIVRGEHVHTWVEVSIQGSVWMPVEPTPGYELEQSPQSLLARLMFLGRKWFTWWRNRPGFAGSIMFVVVVCGMLRFYLLDVMLYGFWRLSTLRSGINLVRNTLWLLECRAWLAGIDLPAHLPLTTRWLFCLRENNEGLAPLLKRFSELANRICYGPRATELKADDRQLLLDISRNVSIRQFRRSTSASWWGWKRISIPRFISQQSSSAS